MSETQSVFWPGQVPEIVFNLQQLRALASSSRSNVFWAFSVQFPLSTAEVGQAIGKSPQSVRYHTNELLKCGLLVPVQTRKRRARIEEAYVIAGASVRSAPPPVPQEYLHEKRRGFQSIWRLLDRDRAAMNMLENADPSLGSVSNLYIVSPRLSPEHLPQFQREVALLLDKYAALDHEDGVRTRLVAFSCPTHGETARQFRRTTGQALKLEGDSED
ncbi:MAG: helix-turn-helix transcriptional regulator [Armatimonadetes bacterium]|nr:helix-turn-helix transcriptional regulator [Armatimonadota bacterium]